MENQKALEWFGQRDKKSLMAGIVYGQGLKGRARAPQNPAPAGFPQSLWEEANRRADAIMASMAAAEASAEPGETPSDPQFDKEAFCFGVAAGRSLEGWEIDGSTNLSSYTKIMCYIHLDAPHTVSFGLGKRGSLTYLLVDWGDGETSNTTSNIYALEFEHEYNLPGDYIITFVSNGCFFPSGSLTETVDGRVNIPKPSYLNNMVMLGQPVEAYNNVLKLASGFIYPQTSLIAYYAEGTSPYINAGDFAGCSNLLAVTLPENTSINKISVIPGRPHPNRYDTDGMFLLCENLNFENLDVLSFHFEGYACVGNAMFYGCQYLRHVIIPEPVESIRPFAFCFCINLESVELPAGLSYIGDCAFYYNNSLQAISIPDSVTRIGDYAFYYCYVLSSVTIGNGVIHIGDGAFYACYSLSAVTIPDSVTYIGDRAFYACRSLSGVTIPNGVTRIGNVVFSGCYSLSAVTIPDSVTHIGDNAFYGCSSLSAVTIPDSVTYIGASAFSGCSSLSGVTIPNGVTRIGARAFYYCSSLTSVTIPDSVTYIGALAFDATIISDVYYGGSQEQWNEIDFNIITGGNAQIQFKATIHYNSTGPDDVHDE